jgi:DNA-binding MarR family transcriptional regulator
VELTRQGDLFQTLVLELFRLNGELARHGADIAAEFGQTQARWQVLGAAVEAVRTVPQIARRMGLTRQSVQRLANILVDEGLLAFEPNPDHATSPLVAPTDRGRALEGALKNAADRWANAIAKGMDEAALETGLDVIRLLRGRLEGLDPG